MGDIVKSIQERMSGAAPGLDISSGLTNQIIAGQEKKRAVEADNLKAERDTQNDIKKKQAEKMMIMSAPVENLMNDFMANIGKEMSLPAPTVKSGMPQEAFNQQQSTFRTAIGYKKGVIASDNTRKSAEARSAAEKAGNGADYIKNLEGERARLDKELAEFSDYGSAKFIGANTQGSPNNLAKQKIAQDIAEKTAIIEGARNLGVLSWTNTDLKKRKSELDKLVSSVYPEQTGTETKEELPKF